MFAGSGLIGSAQNKTLKINTELYTAAWEMAMVKVRPFAGDVQMLLLVHMGCSQW